MTDLFPAGQFLDLTDDEKLSRPAFEAMQAGVRINPPAEAGFDFARALQSDLEYETFVPDDQGIGRADASANPRRSSWSDAAAITLAAGAAGRTSLREKARYDVPAVPIAMADLGQTVIRGKSDLAVPAVVSDGRSPTHTRRRRWPIARRTSRA